MDSKNFQIAQKVMDALEVNRRSFNEASTDVEAIKDFVFSSLTEQGISISDIEFKKAIKPFLNEEKSKYSILAKVKQKLFCVSNKKNLEKTYRLFLSHRILSLMEWRGRGHQILEKIKVEKNIGFSVLMFILTLCLIVGLVSVVAFASITLIQFLLSWSSLCGVGFIIWSFIQNKYSIKEKFLYESLCLEYDMGRLHNTLLYVLSDIPNKTKNCCLTKEVSSKLFGDSESAYIDFDKNEVKQLMFFLNNNIYVSSILKAWLSYKKPITKQEFYWLLVTFFEDEELNFNE